VTVAEARNRVGGRVISFSDLVAGKNVEGGGELIGSNHPAWVGYAKQFGLEFLAVSDEDRRSVVLGGSADLGDPTRSGRRWRRRSIRSSPTPPRSTQTSHGKRPTPRRSIAHAGVMDQRTRRVTLKPP
jgi:monoamine oxidase